MELQQANQQMVPDRRDGCVEGQADPPQQMRVLQQQQGLSFQVHFKCFAGGNVIFQVDLGWNRQTDTVSYGILHILNILQVEKWFFQVDLGWNRQTDRVSYDILHVFHHLFQMFRHRVDTFDAENRLVRQERQEISLNINSNATLVELATAVGALVGVYLFLKRQ